MSKNMYPQMEGDQDDEIFDDHRRTDRRIETHIIAKGKRTKRQHPPSPYGGSLTSCSSSAGARDRERDTAAAAAAAAVTTSDESSMMSSTEEEEDMANCLILLAQGGMIDGRKFSDVSPTTAVTMMTTTRRPGFYVYECKTCSRVFPSFQALGGHRASHKKPKPAPPPTPEPAAPLVFSDFDEEEGRFRKTALLPAAAPLSFPGKAPAHVTASIIGNNKQKIHECSICGSEFGSGQALGGHMRRHRSAQTGNNQAMPANSDAISTSNSPVSDEKPRNILPLDLNLPAPEDERIESKFQFGSTKQPILFSTPALVDCHY